MQAPTWGQGISITPTLVPEYSALNDDNRILVEARHAIQSQIVEKTKTKSTFNPIQISVEHVTSATMIEELERLGWKVLSLNDTVFLAFPDHLAMNSAPPHWNDEFTAFNVHQKIKSTIESIVSKTLQQIEEHRDRRFGMIVIKEIPCDAVNAVQQKIIDSGRTAWIQLGTFSYQDKSLSPGPVFNLYVLNPNACENNPDNPETGSWYCVVPSAAEIFDLNS